MPKLFQLDIYYLDQEIGDRGVSRRGRRIEKKKNAVPHQLRQTISLIGIIQRAKYL